jgi:ubiquinone/menaquinone biosynthesis C-methylase UbiE
MFGYVDGQHSSCTPKVQNIANTICKIKFYLFLDDILLSNNAMENKKKENISNVEFVLSSGELMDKTWEKKFDWIIIVDVLHDLPNPDQCLAEVKRVLKDACFENVVSLCPRPLIF